MSSGSWAAHQGIIWVLGHGVQGALGKVYRHRGVLLVSRACTLFFSRGRALSESGPQNYALAAVCGVLPSHDLK